MQKLKFILFLILLYPNVSNGQACGAGLYSLKIFPSSQYKNLQSELYYISEDHANGLINYKFNSKNWTENQSITNGILIDSVLSDSIVQKSHKRNPFNVKIKNNILKVPTLELAKGLVLIKIINNEKTISILTNAGGCARTIVALIWDEDPKISRIDYSLGLENLEFNNGKEKLIEELEQVDLVYECFGCKSTISDSVVVYARKDRWRKKLVSVPIHDFYLDDIELVKLQEHTFIYVHSNHTYGHSNGELFSLSRNMLVAEKVNVKKNNYVIPDSLSIRKGFGLSKNENNEFTNGFFLRSKNTGMGYGLTNYYTLEKIDWNLYELVPNRTEITESN